MGSGFEQSQYSRKEMVIGIDQLRQADKHPSTFFRPQLESAGYDPHQGQPLHWKDVGRESWRWHLQEKAGMRLEPAPGSGNGDSIEDVDDLNSPDLDGTADDAGAPEQTQ